MKKLKKLALIATLTVLSTSVTVLAKDKAKDHAESEYKDWRLITVSHRQDNNTLRAILGNDKAIKAARSEKLKSWPDGAVIAKLVWKEQAHPNWAKAIVPGEFKAAEAMIKDSKKYATTGGWGFAHWVKGQLKMHDQKTSNKCFGCHTIVKDKDYVFNSNAVK